MPFLQFFREVVPVEYSCAEKIGFETQNTANYSATISWMPLTESKGGNHSAASAVTYAFLHSRR